MFRRHFLAALLALPLAVPLSAAEPTAFPLKDGDFWAMAGDSITAQHLHSNYFEAFCYAGVGGHTIPSTLARFNYDVAGWKPTVVSVELGMNDAGGTATDKFVAKMATMFARIKEAGARPVILSASPVNDGLGAEGEQLGEIVIGDFRKCFACYPTGETLELIRLGERN